MHWRRVLVSFAASGFFVGCSSHEAQPAPTPAAATSTTTPEVATTLLDSTTFMPFAFDETGLFALSGGCIGLSGERQSLVRFARDSRRATAAKAMSYVITVRRAGPWLWVLRSSARGAYCGDASTPSELLWMDPQTLDPAGSLGLGASSAGAIAVAGQQLWIGTANGVVRVDVADGQRLSDVGARFDGPVTALAAPPSGDRVFAATLQDNGAVTLSSFDARTGRRVAVNPAVRFALTARLSATDDGVWLSTVGGSLGTAEKFDRDTLRPLPVRVDAIDKPVALRGDGVLWVDETWASYIGCADPTTGNLAWRQTTPITTPDSIISFPVSPTGTVIPFRGLTAIDTPTECRS